MLRKSHTFSKKENEHYRFMKLLDDGRAKVKKKIGRELGFTYRKFKVVKAQPRYMSGHFIDQEFTLDQTDFENLDPHRKIVPKRLYDLYKSYPLNDRPDFFCHKKQDIQNQGNQSDLPICLNQMKFFTKKYFRTFFVDQKQKIGDLRDSSALISEDQNDLDIEYFRKDGYYEFVVNRDGKFVNQIVDDYIPVYAKTMEPIWGLDVEEAWKIMLIKVYAKIKGGYDKILHERKPFDFIDVFSDGIYKYFNLAHEKQDFLEKYHNKLGLCRIFLKSNKNKLVQKSGLIPDSLFYEIGRIKVTKKGAQNSKNEFLIQIKSVVVTNWTGQKGILDKNLSKQYENQFRLSNYFCMNQKDFYNLFSNAYIISSNYEEPHFSNFITIKQQPDSDAQSHFIFHAKHKGWFNFSFHQPESNRIPINLSSQNMEEKKSKKKRYLKVRFVLSRQVEYKEKESQLLLQRWEGYRLPQYQSYVIEYMQGYCKGDGKFELVVPGKYLIWFKPEKVSKSAQYNFHWSSQQNVPLQLIPDVKQKQSGIFLSQSMASIIPDIKTSYIYDNKKSEDICYGDYFDSFGYGLIAVRVKLDSFYKLLLQFNPELINKCGYRFLSPYHEMNDSFSIMISQGQAVAIVLQQDGNKSDIKRKWPPEGVKLYRQI